MSSWAWLETLTSSKPIKMVLKENTESEVILAMVMFLHHQDMGIGGLGQKYTFVVLTLRKKDDFYDISKHVQALDPYADSPFPLYKKWPLELSFLIYST